MPNSYVLKKVSASIIVLIVAMTAGCGSSENSNFGTSNNSSSITALDLRTNGLCLGRSDGFAHCGILRFEESSFFSLDSSPMEQSYPGEVVDISAGIDEMCVLLDDGTAHCENKELNNVGAISLDYSHACAAFDDGTAQCWGDNKYGELGDDSTTWSIKPVDVKGLRNVSSIRVGQYNSCAALQDGTSYCWGEVAIKSDDNPYGWMKDETTPVFVNQLTNVAEINPAISVICASTWDGTAYCSGYAGSLSDSERPEREFRQVPSLNNISTLFTDNENSCAALRDGTVACWDHFHDEGRPSYEPTQIPGLSDVVKITVSSAMGCALLRDGAVQCWHNGPAVGGKAHNTPYQPYPVIIDSIG